MRINAFSNNILSEVHCISGNMKILFIKVHYFSYQLPIKPTVLGKILSSLREISFRNLLYQISLVGDNRSIDESYDTFLILIRIFYNISAHMEFIYLNGISE